MWGGFVEILKSLDWVIALGVSAFVYVKKVAKKDLDAELLEKRVRSLEETMKSVSLIEKEMDNMRTNVHSLKNSVNNLQATISLNSKDEQERHFNIEKKINLLLFGLQVLFKKDGLDLNDYKDFS